MTVSPDAMRTRSRRFSLIRIPDAYQDLFDRPIIVSLATVQPDGQPQVTPVWADYVDGHVRVNTAAGRQNTRT